MSGVRALIGPLFHPLFFQFSLPRFSCVLTSFFLESPDENYWRNVMRIEAEALRARRPDWRSDGGGVFSAPVDLLYGCAGRVVGDRNGEERADWRKIAATLSSTGTPSLYLHPVEALHGI